MASSDAYGSIGNNVLGGSFGELIGSPRAVAAMEDAAYLQQYLEGYERLRRAGIENPVEWAHAHHVDLGLEEVEPLYASRRRTTSGALSTYDSSTPGVTSHGPWENSPSSQDRTKGRTGNTPVGTHAHGLDLDAAFRLVDPNPFSDSPGRRIAAGLGGLLGGAIVDIVVGTAKSIIDFGDNDKKK